jgi:hypothetical protein
MTISASGLAVVAIAAPVQKSTGSSSHANPTPLDQTAFVGVREAKDERVEHLIGEDLARRQGQRVIFVRDLLDTRLQREIAAATQELAIETGLVHCHLADGETVTGVYGRRLALASGRFAMLDGGPGYRLVPWKPSLERHLGCQVSCLVNPRGIVWTFDRRQGPSIG